MSDKPDDFGNYCPDCGEPREVCQCGENEIIPFSELGNWHPQTWFGEIDDEDEDEWVVETCSCPYCFCSNYVEYGEVCADCYRGEHQG